jgi:hypothetical protein
MTETSVPGLGLSIGTFNQIARNLENGLLSAGVAYDWDVHILGDMGTLVQWVWRIWNDSYLHSNAHTGLELIHLYIPDVLLLVSLLFLSFRTSTWVEQRPRVYTQQQAKRYMRTGAASQNIPFLLSSS